MLNGIKVSDESETQLKVTTLRKMQQNGGLIFIKVKYYVLDIKNSLILFSVLKLLSRSIGTYMLDGRIYLFYIKFESTNLVLKLMYEKYDIYVYSYISVAFQ